MKYLPDDFFIANTADPRRVRRRTQSELEIARDMAVEKPGNYVQVGETRRLDKDMSAWCSEVNTGKKALLHGYPGTFRAYWWVEDDELVDGQKEYGKAIIYELDE